MRENTAMVSGLQGGRNFKAYVGKTGKQTLTLLFISDKEDNIYMILDTMILKYFSVTLMLLSQQLIGSVI